MFLHYGHHLRGNPIQHIPRDFLIWTLQWRNKPCLARTYRGLPYSVVRMFAVAVVAVNAHWHRQRRDLVVAGNMSPQPYLSRNLTLRFPTQRLSGDNQYETIRFRIPRLYALIYRALTSSVLLLSSLLRRDNIPRTHTYLQSNVQSVMGLLFSYNTEALMGSIEDPPDGIVVAKTCLGAVAVYAVPPTLLRF
jgi:hypothetical protein